MTPEVIPWMSPCLSQSMRFVLTGIGHPVQFRRGEVIYASPGLFGSLMYVRSGFVVKALLDPVRDEPLLLSIAGPGAFCGNYENLYVRDRMPRRHWCLTSTEVLVVNQELLLKIADQTSEWQHELSGYSSVSSICDRMGMFLNYSGTVEERLGALLLLMLHSERPSVMANLFAKGVEWVELPFYPDKGTLARLLGCRFETVNGTVRQWVEHDDIRKRSRKIWLRRRTFLKYWEWLMPFLQQSRAEERAAQALEEARRREEYDSF